MNGFAAISCRLERHGLPAVCLSIIDPLESDVGREQGTDGRSQISQFDAQIYRICIAG
jgi:hypothetical protein